MAVNPSGLPNKYKWVDRFMENQIRFTKTLIPDGQLPESTMARIFRMDCRLIHRKIFWTASNFVQKQIRKLNKN
jgi:hypothetical protein